MAKADMLAAMIPGAQVRLLHVAGHLFLIDQPADSAQFIRKFLAHQVAAS